jgi:hypothetical protein
MKLQLTSLLLVSLFSGNSFAAKLSDIKPYKFETLFTNPECETYKYDRSVITYSGKNVDSKPDNVYCKPSDEAASVARENSPQYRLIEWISAKDTKEIYAAYLSFSNKNIVKAMCRALNKGVKIKLVLDGGSEPEVSLNKDAEGLKKCGDVEVTYRGSTGGLGYAHNKILLVNPNDLKEVKIVFSSGNMTSGTSINHENWNFVTTSPQSYFAGVHKCVIGAMIVSGDKKANFARHLNACRAEIKAKPETDITVYFSPVDGKEALKKVTESAHDSVLIEGISHRLSGAIAALFSELVKTGKRVRFLLDDDIYWAEKLKKDIGRNTKIEAFRIYNELINKGMNTRFLETNQNVFQLQHNKFIIFTHKNGGAVFTGAGNMTSAAFTKNFENFYYITIPEVIEAYNEQYDLYFDKMATKSEDMPRDYLLP